MAPLFVMVGCTDTAPVLDPPSPPGPELDDVVLETVASGLRAPVDLAAPPGDPRLFIVEQRGQIQLIVAGTRLETPFLDLRDRVVSGGERGLLGLAFPPDYSTTGVFYVNYTGNGGTTHVSRFRVSADPNVADPTSERILLSVDQPFSNHNGGQIRFGPDGMLYIGMGDGGGGGDPVGAGQNANSLLGAMLRIDVSGAGGYTIPPDNPFVGQAGRRPEIWAIGLRNPWRFSFDVPSQTLFIGDVGQRSQEEIDAVPLQSGGLNFGWNVMEGLECFSGACDQSGLTLPVYVYGRGDGCSVTGGVVYRGSLAPALEGAYLFADYCSGWVRAFRLVDGSVEGLTELDVSVSSPSAFGVDDAGEVYVLSLDGSVQRFTTEP